MAQAPAGDGQVPPGAGIGMKVLFFGTGAFAVPSLEAIARSGHKLVVCVTQPDRPQGRGLAPGVSPVKAAATRLGVPLAQLERPDAAAFAPLRPDVGVAVAYGQLLRRELLTLPPHGVLGVHPSLLPKFRGAAPVPWTLMSGAQETGVTIFRLNEAMDAGDIISQSRVQIRDQETAEELLARLAALGGEALVQALDALAQGRAPATPQDHAHATMAPKLSKAQGAIIWAEPADTLARMIRALIPWPGAWTTWRGGTLKVWRAAADVSASPRAPGTIVEIGADRISVATGQGRLHLLELQPSGKTRMSAQQFVAGYRPAVGDVLGVVSTSERSHA